MRLIDYTSQFQDFADTAALVAQLDLVITVDTAAAHLAGAMGKPVWIMLPFAGGWRWLTDRIDSPWYPTARLFRQPAPGDWKSVYAYAVDPAGRATYLGPIDFSSGAGKAEFTTPGDQFMLVVSPTEGMTTYDPTTNYYFRSDVPAGYKVIPRHPMVMSSSSSVDMVQTGPVTYDVPMLGMASYKGKTTTLKLDFAGELSGLQAHAYLKPVGGKTQIRMTFDDLQKAPMGKRFVLWTSGPEGYTKIGQVIHAGKKDTAEIRGETAMSDFGLFLTAEDIDVDRPTSRVYSTFTVVP